MTVVAIDGPGGAGKSTVAAELAARLDLPHVDTGAFYRAAALAVLRAGVDPHDGDAAARVAARADITRTGGRTLLDGQDVEEEIRGAEVTAVVSAVSAHPQVRAALLARQREGLAHGGVVEGRDAGTAVVPDADVKIWLTASPEERALRRAAQLGREEAAAVARLTDELARRDTADARQMQPAADAVVVDTTGRGPDDVVDELVARVRATIGQRSEEEPS